MNDDSCSVRLCVSLFLRGGRKKQTSSTFVGKTEAYLQFLVCEMAGGNCKCAYGCEMVLQARLRIITVSNILIRPNKYLQNCNF